MFFGKKKNRHLQKEAPVSEVFSNFAALFGPVVQRIECQIPVLMIWVRIPSGSLQKTNGKVPVCLFFSGGQAPFG